MSAVSVLILTLNEEINLADCIDSCAWSDDIVVFDSMSTDHTQEIARAKGARVVERAFDNYGSQRNAALTTVAYKHPWVLMVDADERIPQELAAEIDAATSRIGNEVALFRMRRKDFFMGKWLRRSSGYPSWFGRLVRPGQVRVERAVNEEYLTDGRIEHLHEHLHHYPFNKGVAYWFERHNRYSSMEALAKVDLQRHPVPLRRIFSFDPIIRRRALKHWVYRLPLRPPIIFLYLYFVRLGLFDGRAGFYFSGMRAAYELMIDLKAIEIRRRQQGAAV
jgi:glycosyltransferase involved in cell wall biosynthesis